MKRKEIEYYVNQRGCHICTSHYCIDGYPHFHRKNYGMVKIVRFLWQEKYGRLLPTELLLHSCDNRGCINLEHLKVGTSKENTADAINRNRLAKGKRNGFSRLTDNLVKFIRRSKLSENRLADILGVNRATIGYVRRGKTWTHI